MTILVVGVDPAEGPEVLRADRDRNGYPFVFAPAHPEVAAAFRVVSRSTKIAVNKEGVITYRGGYGVGSVKLWQGIFQELIGPG